MNKTVIIIMRTKNRPLLLERALNSVIMQTHKDWQLVIVNDGGEGEPVNKLVQAVDTEARNKINIIHNQFSLGMEAASNIGIKSTTGRYLVIHDDDDSWAPSFLQIMTSELDKQHNIHSSIYGLVCNTVEIHEKIENNKVYQLNKTPFLTELSPYFINLFKMTKDNLYPPISFLYYYDAIQNIGSYNEYLAVRGDWDFNLRFLLKYDIFVHPLFLARYHVRKASSPVYKNTITAEFNKHLFYDQYLRNYWLRNDLQKGRFGVGAISNTSYFSLSLLKDKILKPLRKIKLIYFQRNRWQNV